MAGTITAIAGAIIGIGGFIFGIVKWHAAQKELKEQKENNAIEDRIFKKFDEKIKPIVDTNHEVVERLDRLEKKQDNNELSRIRTEIMDMVVELNGGLKLTDINHQHIEAEYEKYKALGGNSYIDAQMQLIRDYFKK